MLWTMLEPERVSVKARGALDDPTNLLLVSIASLWEITIKIGAGKLKVPGSDVSFLSDNLADFGIGVLAILLAHLGALQRLPYHHRDPFDRILIAQSQTEQIALVTADAQISRYPVDVLC
jgi:PIN domain nuclease of toxin-antitoxin system